MYPPAQQPRYFIRFVLAGLFVGLFGYFLVFYFHATWLKDLQIYLTAAGEFGRGENPYWFTYAGFGDNFVYPPYALALFSVLNPLPVWMVKAGWVTGAVGAMMGAGVWIGRKFAPTDRPGKIFWLIPATVLFAPVFESVALGQLDPFILLAILLFLYAYDHPHKWVMVAAEILLVVIGSVKVTPLLVLIVPLVQKRFKKITRIAAMGFLWVGGMTIFTGLDVWSDYLATFNNITQSTVIGNSVISAVAAIEQLLNLAGVAYDARVVLRTLDTLVIACTFAAMAMLVWHFRRRKEANGDLIFLVMGLFVTISKLPWFYHLIYLYPLLVRNICTEKGSVDRWILVGVFLVQLSPVFATRFGLSVLATLGYYLIIGQSVARLNRRMADPAPSPA